MHRPPCPPPSPPPADGGEEAGQPGAGVHRAAQPRDHRGCAPPLSPPALQHLGTAASLLLHQHPPAPAPDNSLLTLRPCPAPRHPPRHLRQARRRRHRAARHARVGCVLGGRAARGRAWAKVLPGTDPTPPPSPTIHPCLAPRRTGDDIVIGKTSPIPDDGSGMPQRYSKKVGPNRGWLEEEGRGQAALARGAVVRSRAGTRTRPACAGSRRRARPSAGRVNGAAAQRERHD